jgi:hypothetical protein
MSEMETTMKDFCEDCIVRNKVMGAHGIEDRLERIEEEQKQLGIKIARLEWLVPIVTAALVALVNWVPKILTTAAAVR